jgi:acetyl-CoA C-acetyltransferase
MSSFKGKVALVGVGEVPTGRFPEKGCAEFAILAARQAIREAGINKDEIDFLIPIGAVYSSAYNSDLVCSMLVEELGLKGVKCNAQVFAGGASCSATLKTAAGLISAGIANMVLCIHSDKLGTGVTSQEGIDLFALAGISKEWEVPFGQHYSSIAGLVTERYMFETGTTEEEIASVVVSNRKWGILNPNAMFRKPITVEEVLESKVLSTPLHSKESNMLADGGSAWILTDAERAAELTPQPVYLLGDGSRVTHFCLSQEKDITRFGYREAAGEAFAGAGLKPDEIDVAEIYDSYPIFEMIALEELGFMERGESGSWFREGRTWPGGELPVTTNGGMLSQGHTGAGGGAAVLVEAVRQLQGKAGERQVEGARFAAVTSTGGTYVDAHVEILGTEIP